MWEPAVAAFAPFFVLWTAWLVAGLWSLHPLPKQVSASRASVVVAARNEATHLAATLQQLEGYDVAVAEGPSTDGTRALVPAHQLVPIDAIPDGWVGKSWALWQGAQQTEGDWLVFLDADVLVAPGTIERAVAYAQTHSLHHLTLHPSQCAKTLWGRAALLVIGQGMLVFSPPWAIARGWSHGGLGACQLVRREAYMAAGGHAAIPNEILDDVALGRLLAPSRHVSATRELVADWAQTFPAAVHAMEKNGFAATGYRTFWSALGILYFFVAVAAGAIGWLLGAPETTVAWLATSVPALLQVGLQRGFGPGPRRRTRDWVAALLTPIALLVFPIILLRSMWRTKRGGISWRGSQYHPTRR